MILRGLQIYKVSIPDTTPLVLMIYDT